MTDIKGYYETVRGVNWIAGHAIKKILERGPTFTFYMGLKSKPSIIYDVAYSPDEAMKIGTQVVKGMKLKSTQEVAFGHMTERTAASLYYICQKNYPKPQIDQIYKIEIKYRDNQEHFEPWCLRIKGKLPENDDERKQFYQDWISAGN
jgi:hypothetical protein